MNDSTREQTDRRTQIDEWLAVRKRAGLAIDPDTAEVMWCWAQILDPYGVEGSLDEEYSCIGRVHFARNPGDDVWVAYNDLPEETQFRLRESGRERRALAEFEADLFRMTMADWSTRG